MKVVGFGGCMIQGYPLTKEISYFQIFCDFLNNDGVDSVSTIFSFGGFTVERARKHLDEVLLASPDLVILQFGNVDCEVSLAATLNKRLKRKTFKVGGTPPQTELVKKLNYNLKSVLRATVKYVLCEFLRGSPRVSKASYKSNMECIVKSLTERGVKIIVLLPFVTSDWISNKYARQFSLELKRIAERYKAAWVDSQSVLSNHRYEEFLLQDGMHLSEFGHKVIGQALWNTYQSLS